MLLQVQNLQIGYRKPLVSQISFSLQTGQTVVLFGANGCGKSTLLKSLINSETRLSGQVHWNVKPEEILLISQEHKFHDKTPDYVEDYLLKSRKMLQPFSKDSAHLTEIRNVLSQLKLSNLPLQVLSGGQRQKLKIARALLNQAKVLLLDEPLNAVDAESKKEILQLLKNLSPRTAQIWVLHDYYELQQLQAPVLWIQEGFAESYSFEEWFKKVDVAFHSWMKTNHHSAKNP